MQVSVYKTDGVTMIFQAIQKRVYYSHGGRFRRRHIMKTSNTVRDRFILQNDTTSVTSLWISSCYIFANYVRLVEDKPLRGEQKSKRRRGFKKREARWMQVRIRKLTAGFPWNWWSLVGGATKPHDRPEATLDYEWTAGFLDCFARR